MARAGLGEAWECKFANDFCDMKRDVYTKNWGVKDFVGGDINGLDSIMLPGKADLAWASFPCQDLSLAGNGGGIGRKTKVPETRSGAYWGFWDLISQLRSESRPPRALVLENVVGFLSSNNCADFKLVCETIIELGYRVGATVIDAKLFVPQSRPRVFLIAIREDEIVPPELVKATPASLWHTPAIVRAKEKLSKQAQAQWLWWQPKEPTRAVTKLSSIIGDEPVGCQWHEPKQTQRLLSMMTEGNLAKVRSAMSSNERRVGAIFKRTRLDTRGNKTQRAEVRFDETAGCLRTPGGGSSRQIVLVVQGSSVRSRLLSPREAFRLMGLEADYEMPQRYNDALHVAGDGVCVPVVSFISTEILEQVLTPKGCQVTRQAA